MSKEKVRVGIVGATGMVGQHYVRALEGHPFFHLSFLASSPESAGKSYGEALSHKGVCRDGISPEVLSLPVYGIEDLEKAVSSCDALFSAVSTASGSCEARYAAAGLPLISNTSTHRMEEDIPLLIPEINPDHLSLIPYQQKRRGWSRGFIVTKPNCSLQSYLIPLYPLHRAFGLHKVLLTTMQAVSGAGYPGVSSLDITDNLIPYIEGEEEKSEREPLKILGTLQEGKILPATSITLSAHCNRVPVLDGHTVCVSVQFEKRATAEEILSLWEGFVGLPQTLSLPSAPRRPILYRKEKDRPQPRLDRNAERGMAVTVGRLRPCPILDFRFVALSHNTLRGAALGGVLNAELLYIQNYLSHET